MQLGHRRGVDAHTVTIFVGQGEPQQRIAAQHAVLDRTERAQIAAFHRGEYQIARERPDQSDLIGRNADKMTFRPITRHLVWLTGREVDQDVTNDPPKNTTELFPKCVLSMPATLPPAK